MLKFLWGTDPHFKDINPVSRVDDWTETLLNKFQQMADIARQERVDALLLGGDIFDVSTPSLTSHALVQRLIEEFRRMFSCPIYCNIGNHDVKYQQYRFLDQMPLGTMFSSGVFKRCYDEYEGSFIDLDEGRVVRIVGIPYHGVRYDLQRFQRIKKKGRETIICLAHVLASPKGGKMFEGEDIISYKDLPNLCPDVDLINFGHWHKNQGITELSSGQKIINIGSMTRGSLCEDNINRTPSVALIKISKDIEIEEIPLQVKPVEEVFDLEKRSRQEQREAAVSKFVEKLYEMKNKDSKKSSVGNRINNLDLPEKVRSKAGQVWESVLNKRS